MFVGRVVQPLTSLIRIRRNLDTLKTGVEIAKEQTRADKQKIAREVKKVYYSLQQVDSSLSSVHQTVARYQELARLTENYVAGQVVLKADLLEVQTRLAKVEQSESVLRDQEAAALAALTRTPALANARTKGLPVIPPPPSASWVHGVIINMTPIAST